MCEECRHYPCVSNCPNYEEKPVCNCDICGEDIFQGQLYYEIDSQNICEECIENGKRYAEHEEPDPECWKLTDRLYEESKYEGIV